MSELLDALVDNEAIGDKAGPSVRFIAELMRKATERLDDVGL